MQEEDSDHDEGFIPSKVQIKANKPTLKKDDEDSIKPMDYQPRYIFGQGIFRKQPIQTFARYPKYAVKPTLQSPLSQQQITCRNEESDRQLDSLVYSRYKERGVQLDSDNSTDNEIVLSKVLSAYNQDHYSIFKNFEPPNGQPTDKQIEFNSRFEGGNLMYAFRNKMQSNSYTLFIQNDTNSNGYNQWFYFSLRHATAGIKYRFSIVNFKKKHSFFKHGMKPAVFSLKQAAQIGQGWSKSGSDIKYVKSWFGRNQEPQRKFYTLSFQLVFEHDDDYISIAMNQPYTYSRLIHNLKACAQINNESKNPIQWQLTAVTHSIANNAVPYLTVTGKSAEDSEENSKKVIVMMARQHPGETWSSFLMEEVLYQFVQHSQGTEMTWLLDHYIFKIFPMVNVDGVIYGNFRCDLAGFDLNRNWKEPDRNLHPQIHAIKQQIEHINKTHQIDCVFDFHGHSKEYNIFCYSCKDNPVTCRVLPLLIHRQNPIFHFPFSTFGISKYKETTARAVIYNLINNENVLTIENSFYGAKIDNQIIEFEPYVFQQFSADLLTALQKYLSGGQKMQQTVEDINNNIKDYIKYEKKTKGDSGSESDPYADEICLKEKIKRILPKSFAIRFDDKEESEVTIRKKNVKRKTGKSKVMAGNRKYETLQSKKNELKVIEERPVQTFIDRSSLTQYKRKSKELSSSKIFRGPNLTVQQDKHRKHSLREDHEEVNTLSKLMNNSKETALPFYFKDKPLLVPIKLKNDSFAMFKQTQHSKKRGRLQNSVKKQLGQVLSRNDRIQISEESKNQELPILCVLSESKRMKQIEKVGEEHLRSTEIKPHHQVEQSSATNFSTYLHNKKVSKLKRSERSEREQQLNRQRVNTGLVSKFWRENVARYGHNLNVFLGSLKQ